MAESTLLRRGQPHLPRRPLRLPELLQAVARIPRLRVQRLPRPARLPGEDRIRFRASHVSERQFGRGFGRRFGGGDWRQGGHSSGPWTIPAPTAISCSPLRRLSRIHSRSVEQPVNLDDDDQYDWPWLYGVEVGHWELTDAAGQKLARVPAPRRLLHVRRLPRLLRVGGLHGQHEARLSRPPDRRYRRQRPDLPHPLRSR